SGADDRRPHQRRRGGPDPQHRLLDRGNPGRRLRDPVLRDLSPGAVCDHGAGRHGGGPRYRGDAPGGRLRQPAAAAALGIRSPMTDTAPGGPFGVRLRSAVAERGNLCVGIDPHPALLESWGLGVSAAGVSEFARRAMAAFGDLVPAVKPQVAFFEEYGSAGLAVLEDLLGEISTAGALSVADAKR